MKLSKRNVLYSAGGILLTAALISQFKDADLILATLLVLSAAILLFQGFREDAKDTKCDTGFNSKAKILKVTLGVVVVFFGLGFSVGKLIYLWSH